RAQPDLARDTLLPYTTPFRSGAGLSLVVAGDELLQSLNREHRDVDAPTDVLSFPASELADGEEPFPAPEGQPRYLGDIAVSVERSEEHTSELQSRENLVCRLL